MPPMSSSTPNIWRGNAGMERIDSMNMNFTKMHSLGNDFVMLNGVAKNIRITPDIARFIADRRFGIGCDQIIVAEKAQAGNRFRMRIFNSDGSESGQCGNGARCFAQFLRDQGLTDDTTLRVKTRTTEIALAIHDDGTVTAQLEPPEFAPRQIPLLMSQVAAVYRVNTERGAIEFSALSMGNPHCVIAVERVDCADVAGLGALMERHPAFPERVNVGFSQIVSERQIRLRVYERGVGETLGCGSGASAAVVAGIRNGQLQSVVTVALPGGSVEVGWEGGQAPVCLRGPVHTVFTGNIGIPEEMPYPAISKEIGDRVCPGL